MEHIIVTKEKHRTQITARCLNESCTWVPTEFSECDEHVRDTGHQVRTKEIWETTSTLSAHSQPRLSENK
jgi:hypothetical protein